MQCTESSFAISDEWFQVPRSHCVCLSKKCICRRATVRKSKQKMYIISGWKMYRRQILSNSIHLDLKDGVPKKQRVKVVISTPAVLCFGHSRFEKCIPFEEIKTIDEVKLCKKCSRGNGIHGIVCEKTCYLHRQTNNNADRKALLTYAKRSCVYEWGCTLLSISNVAAFLKSSSSTKAPTKQWCVGFNVRFNFEKWCFCAHYRLKSESSNKLIHLTGVGKILRNKNPVFKRKKSPWSLDTHLSSKLA